MIKEKEKIIGIINHHKLSSLKLMYFFTNLKITLNIKSETNKYKISKKIINLSIQINI